MAVGLPVVASNVGAIPEMIDVPDDGLLFDPQDLDGFATTLVVARTNVRGFVGTGQARPHRTDRQPVDSTDKS